MIFKTEQLDYDDIQELKFRCRMAYFIGFFICVILNAFIFIAVLSLKMSYADGNVQLMLLSSFIISGLIIWLINRKYYSDLSNQSKELIIKIVQKKENNIDYGVGQLVKENTRYDLIIENTRYWVSKELFEQCKEGDEIIFHTAPKSRHILKKVLKKN